MKESELYHMELEDNNATDKSYLSRLLSDVNPCATKLEKEGTSLNPL